MNSVMASNESREIHHAENLSLASAITMESRNAAYLSLWRWHFYADLVVAPFVLLLSVTGAIYLFKPYFETWRYRSLYEVPHAGRSAMVKLSAPAVQELLPCGWGTPRIMSCVQFPSTCSSTWAEPFCAVVESRYPHG